jgi:hypothetical protein
VRLSRDIPLRHRDGAPRPPNRWAGAAPCGADRVITEGNISLLVCNHRRVRRAFAPCVSSVAIALALLGCGSSNKRDATAPPPTPPQQRGTLNLDVPRVDATDRRIQQGRLLVIESGCLACHRIGNAGNRGPGRSLTMVGDRLSPDAIRRVLLYPAAPMAPPSLSRARREALIAYLSGLGR